MGRVRDDGAPSDAVLLAALRKDDILALGQVFDRHARRVHAYCHRRCGDRTQAEDQTSATFLEFWTSRGRALLSDDSLLPWLLGIANNVARNSERSQRRFVGALARVGPQDPVPDHADAVADIVGGQQLAADLRHVIRQLRRTDRELLSLSLYGDLTMRQIAATLGVPEGTVKSRLSRLRERVGRQLELRRPGVRA